MKLVDDFLKIYTSPQHLYEMGQTGKFATLKNNALY